MTQTLPNIRVNAQDPIRGTLRFIAWFGIVYGLLGAFGFVPQVIRTRQFHWMLLTTRRPDAPFWISLMMIQLSSIWLMLGCIGMLLGRRSARTWLIVWAIVVLTLEITHVTGYTRLSGWELNASFSTAAIRLATMAISMAFPAAVLWLLYLRQSASAITGVRDEGFQVIREPHAKSNTAAPVELLRATDAQSLFEPARCIAWIAVGVGFFASIDALCRFGYWPWGWAPNDGRDRLLLVDAAQRASQLSYVLPLVGGVLMLFRLRAGRWIVLTWVGLLLALNVIGLVLYDVQYVWWQATKARYHAQTPPEMMASFGYMRMQTAAFPLVAWHVLRQTSALHCPALQRPV